MNWTQGSWSRRSQLRREVCQASDVFSQFSQYLWFFSSRSRDCNPLICHSEQKLRSITNQIDERRAVWSGMPGLWPPSHLALPVPSAACLYPGDSCASPVSHKQGCRAAAAAAAREQIWRNRQVRGKRKWQISWMLKMAPGFRTLINIKHASKCSSSEFIPSRRAQRSVVSTVFIN